jgi:cytochrome oxidase Cu insertion factor (SCO1/SenC/PrrC family)
VDLPPKIFVAVHVDLWTAESTARKEKSTMPGMNTGLPTSDPTILAAFKQALLHQFYLVLGILILLAFLALVWNVLRSVKLSNSPSLGDSSRDAAIAWWSQPEPTARRLLRIGFGLIWIFDGLLQGQASMPLGMTTQVIQPTAATSPHWVQHLVNIGATIWSNHPIEAPASAVWIQIGIGIWLIVAPRGTSSRLAGLSSAYWGVVVWIFGESFGGIFAPGLTWAFGAPGAVLFYSFAGVLVALPERAWTSPRLGRIILSCMGIFFVGMSLLQAWPGRGFWQGHIVNSHAPGTLTTMVQQMANTPQPRFLSIWVSSFASFDADHGWAVNLFLVIVLATIGVMFLSNRVRVIRVGVIAGIILCLADWVLVEDFGFLGGTGTDPNSMIPMLLIFVAGYLAIVKMPSVAQISAPIMSPDSPLRSWWRRVNVSPSYPLRSLAALAAVAMALVGAVPMAFASTNPNADPIIAQAIDGAPNAVNIPAHPFNLVDQFNHAVSLGSLHGKTVVLSFLDPVCVSDCPLIAQELRIADNHLSATNSHIEFVSININPLYTTPDYLVAFDRQEGLEHLTNWLFLTGSVGQLSRIWNSYGIQVSNSPAGAMIAHSDYAFIIGANGKMRSILNDDPGPGTAASKSSFAVTVVNEVKRVMHSS